MKPVITEDADPTTSEQAIDEALSIISKTSDGNQSPTPEPRNGVMRKNHDETIDSVLNEVSQSSDADMKRTLSQSRLIGTPSVSFGRGAVIFMIVGLVITILAILSGGSLPVPPLKQWNAIIGVFLICYGFLFTLHWR